VTAESDQEQEFQSSHVEAASFMSDSDSRLGSLSPVTQKPKLTIKVTTRTTAQSLELDASAKRPKPQDRKPSNDPEASTSDSENDTDCKKPNQSASALYDILIEILSSYLR
jgi:hypothetical protein